MKKFEIVVLRVLQDGEYVIQCSENVKHLLEEKGDFILTTTPLTECNCYLVYGNPIFELANNGFELKCAVGSNPEYFNAEIIYLQKEI